MGAEPTTGTLEQLTGDAGVDPTPSGARVYRKREQVRPRDIPAEAVEAIRARLEEIGSAWHPSVDLDVEAMLREA